MSSIPTTYENFIALSRYARWQEEQGRRETWGETVDRFMNFMVPHIQGTYGKIIDPDLVEEIRDAIFNREVMPSMRALMTAGPALARDHIAAYNCSFIAVDSPRAFDEAMYILMCGTGVGFSVESRYVDQLPIVNEHFENSTTTIVVEDSKAGWARSFRELLALLWQGQIPEWDMSKVRPAGAPLKTFGGRASGPEPLHQLFDFSINLFVKAAGRRLTPLEAHDLLCKVGEVVVVGGVRRSAMISLSDLGDYDMAKAKSGNWWEAEGQRSLANNSAVYNQKPSFGQFLSEWGALYESQSGERGIFNLGGNKKKAASIGRDASKIAGTNPCGEILLRANQFCNLTEVVIRENDSFETLDRKVELAAILGTWQSTLTNFKYIRKIWKDNSEEERLLGVSLTGIFGNVLTNGNTGMDTLSSTLRRLRDRARNTNYDWADDLGIQRSAAVTTVKPSGTVSQLTGVSSGIHPWHSDYYIRTVRADNKDPMTIFLKDSGIYNEADVMRPDSTTVFYFPKKAPAGAVVRNDLTAVDHLEIWKAYKENWTDHNPSVTINVREDEWLEVAGWVWKNWDYVGGISFLPYSDHVYQQAPYIDITEAEYKDWVAKTPTSVNWDVFPLYEIEDTTSGSQDLACVAGECEVVDIVSSENSVVSSE
jgi:ribonucleoside-triphosphate reductase (thioredoxin)